MIAERESGWVVGNLEVAGSMIKEFVLENRPASANSHRTIRSSEAVCSSHSSLWAPTARIRYVDRLLSI